jgi:hypothetical protein
MIGVRDGYWLIGQPAPTLQGEIMERDASNHPGPDSGRVNIQGRDLSDDELSALTPEQRTRLTSGEPLPVDPRSPFSDNPLVDETAGRSPVAVALDQVEGTGDGDGDGLMDHGTASGEDKRETDKGATTDEWIDERNAAAGEVSTPIAAGLREPAAWDENAAASTKPAAKPATTATRRSPE